jgi:hypothetical protein
MVMEGVDAAPQLIGEANWTQVAQIAMGEAVEAEFVTVFHQSMQEFP